MGVCEAHTHSCTSLDISECIWGSLNGLDIAMACLWVLGSQCHGLLGHASCHCKVMTARFHQMAYRQLDRQPVIFCSFFFYKRLGESSSVCSMLLTFLIWRNNLSSISTPSLVSELSNTSWCLQKIQFLLAFDAIISHVFAYLRTCVNVEFDISMLPLFNSKAP